MPNLYSNDKVREKAEELVRQNVHYCVSYLIGAIARPQGRNADLFSVCEALGLDYDDDLMPLLEITDYESAADDHVDSMDADELRSYLESVDVEFIDDADDDDDDTPEEDRLVDQLSTSLGDLRSLAKNYLYDNDEHQKFCGEFDLEANHDEVYEHWIVDNWFAGKLEERGHPIARDFLGLTIWGRPTTGQSLSLDSVILEIANDLLKD